jgi:hypothetical protein
MLSCAEHDCRLKLEPDVAIARLTGQPLTPELVSAPVAAMDGRTDEGLTTGQVTLPPRTVHVGVWLRLLRRLLHELSVPVSRLGRSRAAIERIWQEVGRPIRAGLNIWRPYEQLDRQRQEALLEAAALALALIEAGEVTASGTLAPLLIQEPDRPVYAGDSPDPNVTAFSVVTTSSQRPPTWPRESLDLA